MKGRSETSLKWFSTPALCHANGQSEMFLCSQGCVVFVPLGLCSRLLILAVVMEAYKVFVFSSDTVQGLFPVRPLC